MFIYHLYDLKAKKLNHVFNDNKDYHLFFIYTKLLSTSSYMTVRKTLYKAKQGFLDGVHNEI